MLHSEKMIALQILVLTFLTWTTAGEKEVPVSDLVPKNGTLTGIDFNGELISLMDNLKSLISDPDFCSIPKSEAYEEGEDDKQEFCRIVELCQQIKKNEHVSGPCSLFHLG